MNVTVRVWEKVWNRFEILLGRQSQQCFLQYLLPFFLLHLGCFIYLAGFFAAKNIFSRLTPLISIAQRISSEKLGEGFPHEVPNEERSELTTQKLVEKRFVSYCRQKIEKVLRQPSWEHWAWCQKIRESEKIVIITIEWCF